MGNGVADTGTADVYSFYTDSGGASTFDIDNTTGGFNSFLEVIDSNGVVLASNDGGGTDAGSPGATADAHVSVTLPSAGVYYVRVTNGTAAADAGTKAGASAGSATGATAGQTYDLNISVPGSQNYATLGAGGLPVDAETNLYIDVNPGFDDAIVEPTENVGVQITGIKVGDPQITLAGTKASDPLRNAAITIADNDSATVSIAGTKDATEPSTDGEFTFTMTKVSSTDTKLKWTLDDPNSTTLSATTVKAADPSESADHSLADSGYVTILAGKTQATLTVPVVDSSLIEEDETLTIDFTIDTADPDVTPGTTEGKIKFGDEDTATVDVDAKVAPAYEGGSNGEFHFFLSEPPGYPTGTPGLADRDTVVTFDISGIAGHLTDYDLKGATVTGSTGTVTIPAYSSKAIVTVDATGKYDDALLEGIEDVTLTIKTLEAPTDSNIKIGAGSPADSLDIIDNDGLTVKVVGTTDAAEPASPGTFTFSTVGTGTTAVPTVVTYQVKVGSSTAIEGTDFKALTGTVSIPAGAAPQSNTVTITPIDDLLFEGDETITIEILTATGGPGITVDAMDEDSILLKDNEPGTVTIVDLKDGAEASQDGEFTIELGGKSATPTIVKYEILSTKTAATPGVDYTSVGSPYGTVTIPAFLTQATVTVPVINDNIPEPTETVDISLDSIVSGQKYALGADKSLNIYSDQVVSVKATDAKAAEPSDDGKFTLSLDLDAGGSATSDVDTIVTYDILTGAADDATNGSDYAKLSGTATILAGKSSVDVVVDVTDDTTLEGTENVRLLLTGITSGEADVTLAGVDSKAVERNATVTIDDNDLAYLTVEATKTPGEDNPGSDVDAEFTVFISQPVDVPTVVEYDVSAGTATSKTDYTALSGSVTIAANATSATILVDVLDDAIIEGTESLTIDLKDPQLDTKAATHPYDSRIFLGALGALYVGPGDSLLEFRQGGSLGFGPHSTGPYTGTEDASVKQFSPTLNFSIGDIDVDVDVFPGPSAAAEHGLLQFNGFIGTGMGQIPAGSPILDADLNLDVFNTGTVSFHTLLADFDESTITWLNSALGGNVLPGIQADGMEASVAGDIESFGFGNNTVGVTSTVQDWIDGKASNFGWAILPTSTNLVEIEGSEDPTFSQRPELHVHLDVSATVDIIDTDVATVTVVDSAAVDAGEPATPGEIVLRLVDGSNSPVTSTSAVTVSYTDLLTGTATSGSDYVPLSGTATIPAGMTQTSIMVVPNNDSLIEPQESVNIEVTKVTSADPQISKGADTTGTTNINDDDFGLVTVIASKSAADENKIGTPGLAPIDGEFEVSISTPSSTDTVVEVSITGSATSGMDYKAISTLVTIPANTTKVAIPVDVIDDVINESASEDVIMKLVSIKSGNAGIITAAPSTATVTIADDEQTLTASTKATKASASEQIGVSSVDGELQIQLNWASDEDTVIEYTVGGTATDFKGTSAPDYDASQFPGVDASTIDGLGGKTLAGKITILAGKTSATFPVDVFNDYVAEGPETVDLTITKVTNANGVAIGTATDTVTIDDGIYEVKVEKTDSPASEPGPPTGSNGQFTFTISNPLPEATTIYYSVDPSSTASDTIDPFTGKADYVALSGTIVLPANQTQVTLDVDVIDDFLVESTESIIVELKSASSTGASYASPAGIPTITVDSTKATEMIADNDDASITITGSDGAEPSSDGKFIISQTLKSAVDTEVTYKVNASSTATGGSDYDDTDFTGVQTATILAGDTSVSITVPVMDDSEVEPTETVTVDLIAPVGPTDADIKVGSPSTHTVNITDDDVASVSVLATDPNGFEPGTNDGIFTIFLSAPSATDTVVSFQLGAGTDATMGSDFLLRDKTSTGATVATEVTIPAGATTYKVIADVLDDTLIEDLESIELELTKTDNAKITVSAAKSATVTISPDDDFGKVSIAGTKDANEAGSVAGEFTVTLDTLSDEDTTVTWSISGGTATKLDHGLAATGSVVIPAMKTQATISVPVVDDNIAEITEDLEVTLTGVTKGHTSNISVDVGNKADTIDILDDDASVLTISSPTVTEGDSGSKALTFVVTSPSAVAGGFTVDYKVTDITTGKFGGADYTGSSTGTLSFSGTAGETDVVTLMVTGDELVEATETLKVSLGTATPGSPLVISGAEGIGTITNDDTATFTIDDVTVTEGSSGDPTKAPWTPLTFTVTLDNPIDVDTTIDIDFDDLTAVGGDFDPLLALKAPNNKVPVTINGFDYDDDAADSKSGFAGGTISQVTFLAGESSPGNVYNAAKITPTYTVRVVQDNIVEGGTGVPTGPADPGVETFTATLTDDTATRKTVTKDTGTGTITDDDSAVVSIVANDAKASEPLDTVNEGDGQFTLTQSYISDSDTVVTYTVSGTADHKGSDYTPLSGSVTITAGSTQATIDVTVVDSAELEDDETVVVTLTGFSSRDPNVTLKSGYTDDTVTIFDDDQAEVTVAASDAAASEDPLDNGEFTLTLSEVSDVDTIITYDMIDSTSSPLGADGKATEGADYKALSGTATILAGQTTTTVTVDVLQDVTVEGAEDVILQITGFKAPTNADIKIGAADEATVTIADDIDGIIVNVFNNGDGTESTPATNPGSFIFTITKDDGVTPVAAPSGGLTIQYSSIGGTATPGPAGDYIALPGTVFIPMGATQLVHDFTVNDDAAPEPDETVILTIQNLVHSGFPGGEPATIGANPATVTILDNDSVPPEVESVEINGGDAQRSNLKTIKVTFDSTVSVDPTAFSVEQRSDVTVGAVTGTVTTATGLVVGAPTVVSGKTVVELTFDFSSGNSLIDVRDSLVNGNFQVKIDATKILHGSEQLDGNSDGTGGDDFLYGDQAADNVFALFGDSDGDGDVDLTDLSAFGTAFTTLVYDEAFDVEGDGDIDLTDLAAFGSAFTSLSMRDLGGF